MPFFIVVRYDRTSSNYFKGSDLLSRSCSYASNFYYRCTISCRYYTLYLLVVLVNPLFIVVFDNTLFLFCYLIVLCEVFV